MMTMVRNGSMLMWMPRPSFNTTKMRATTTRFQHYFETNVSSFLGRKTRLGSEMFTMVIIIVLCPTNPR